MYNSKQKGMGFSGFSMSKKPKESASVLGKPGNKVGQHESTKALYKPTEKQESEMYNPFEPTLEPSEIKEAKPKAPPKPKKKRKS